MSQIKETFERVAAHLLKQKVKSARVSSIGKEICRYRHYDSPSGTTLKCAVGCLISDEAYDSCAEGLGIADVFISEGKWTSATTWAVTMPASGSAALAKMLDDSQIPATPAMHILLMELQEIHDLLDPSKWEAALEDFRCKKFPGLMNDSAMNGGD